MENNKFPREISLCLSGGAARGAYHLGVVSVLQENKIEIKAISGTSIGALIGASLACGKKAQEIFEILKSKEFKKAFKLSLGKGYLFRINLDAPVIEKLLDKNSFEELEIPLSAAVTNVLSADVEYYQSGNNLRELVLASCSISPLFKPISLDGKLFVDGGLIDNFPVEQLKKYKMPILGINLYPFIKNRPDSIFKWLKKNIFIAWQYNNLQKSRLCDIYLSNSQVNQLATFSFKDIDKAYKLGQIDMKELLDSYS